jgi:hypothetical protein
LVIFVYRYYHALSGFTLCFYGICDHLIGQSLKLTVGISLAILGIAITAYAVDHIRDSEIGLVCPMSWKIMLALFANRWWFRSPQVVVVATGDGLCITLRAVKRTSRSVTALVPVLRDGWDAWEPYFLALAAREEALEDLLTWELPSLEGTVTLSALIGDHLRRVNGNLPPALSTLSQSLAVEGAIIPLTPDTPLPGAALVALQQADIILIGPGDLKQEILPALIPLTDALRSSPARKFFIAPVAARRQEGRATSLSELIEAIHRAAGGPLLDGVLVNTNRAPSLPDPDLAYLVVDESTLRALGIEIVGRDTVDWSAPTRHDLYKLEVWLEGPVFGS